MTGASIGAEAIGAASLRRLASEWGGSSPDGSRGPGNRSIVRAAQRTGTPRR